MCIHVWIEKAAIDFTISSPRKRDVGASEKLIDGRMATAYLHNPNASADAVMVRIVEDLIGDWSHLDERIENVTEEIEALARGDASCRQLMTVPGVGPIIASAMVAAIGNGTAFAKGRDFAAWLGLVPKQMSTGDRTILGRITKRGNRYLRTLFMQGARVILLRPANWAKHSFGLWLTAAAQRLHHNVLATALANKLARIAWTVLAQGRSYEARVEPEVA
jgi:transposase